MTLTTARQHRQDRENERKLEGRHHDPCAGCGAVVSDQDRCKIGMYTFCDKDCAAQHIERLEYKLHEADEHEKQTRKALNSNEAEK